MRLHVRISPLTVLCAAVLSLGMAACGSTTSTTTAARGRHVPLISIVQSDGALITNPTATLAAFKALGAQVIRFTVQWSSIAPAATSRREPAGFDAADPGSPEYNWAQLDSIDRAAAASHIKLYLTLTQPAPLWATQTGAPQGCAQPCQHWKPSAADYGQWVTAVGRRYSGHYTPAGQSTPLPRVSFWSLWNEPNYGPDLAPQSTVTHDALVDEAAPQYRQLLDAGWRALHASGHTPRTDTILIGETAPVGELDPGTDNMTLPLQFARDLYCVSNTFTPLTGAAAAAEGCPRSGASSTFIAENPALFKASGWADHPYQQGIAPDQVTTGPGSAEFATLAQLPNLVATLDRAAAAYGASSKLPIYSTEFGYFTMPPGTAADQAVPLATAAAYLNWSEYVSWKNPQIDSYDQYLLADPAPDSGSKFDTGLEFDTGQPKPDVYDAYRMPLWLPKTTASTHQALQVWGCARPALASPAASRRVTIQFASSGGAFRSIRTVTLHPASDGCYFDIHMSFPASGSVRLSYQDGTQVLTSRIQSITIR